MFDSLVKKRKILQIFFLLIMQIPEFTKLIFKEEELSDFFFNETFCKF